MKDNTGHIFLCANSTEKECFDRLLFGGKEAYRKKVPVVNPGDTLFLFNYQENLLHGIFKATSEAKLNIEPDAWKGVFPWQVKVEIVNKCKPLSSADLLGVLSFKKYPSGKLTGEQVQELIQLFNAKKRLPFFEKIIPYTCDDGHRVRSNGEVVIDNWLYTKGILHAYEKQLISENGIPETMYCDFYIPGRNVYIEFWGLNDQTYKKRKEQKIEFYKNNKLNLIEVFPQDLKRIDEILKPLCE